MSIAINASLKALIMTSGVGLFIGAISVLPHGYVSFNNACQHLKFDVSWLHFCSNNLASLRTQQSASAPFFFFLLCSSGHVITRWGGRGCHCGSCSQDTPSAPACSRCCRRWWRCKWLWRAWSTARTRGSGSAPAGSSAKGRGHTASSWCPSPPSRTPPCSWRAWCPWSPGLSAAAGGGTAGAADGPGTPQLWSEGLVPQTRCPDQSNCGGSRRWMSRCHDQRFYQWWEGWASPS